mmetsp:Transcript_59493/g.163190  ORF Transcript_59493/g.163190 Transcript_59493/m.163190 type:complete len:144 (+) Transcript_59493:32-463(+)
MSWAGKTEPIGGWYGTAMLAPHQLRGLTSGPCANPGGVQWNLRTGPASWQSQRNASMPRPHSTFGSSFAASAMQFPGGAYASPRMTPRRRLAYDDANFHRVNNTRPMWQASRLSLSTPLTGGVNLHKPITPRSANQHALDFWC